MATFAVANFTGTTIEEHLLQAALAAQKAEQAYPVAEGAARQNRVNVTVNTETNLATITATLPISTELTASGYVGVHATEYIIFP